MILKFYEDTLVLIPNLIGNNLHCLNSVNFVNPGTPADYARALDVILQRKINRLKTMQDKLNKVRSQLHKEEEISKTLRRPAKKR